MAGKRMIHSNICESKKLSEISLAAETLYYRLLTRADDDGNFTADPRIVLGSCAPLRKEWNEELVLGLLEELSTLTIGDKKPLIQFYNKEGDKFLHITKFEEFQYLRPDRTAIVKFPTHPARMGASLVNQRYTGDATMSGPREEKLSEVKLREEKRSECGFKNLAVRYRKAFHVNLSHGEIQKKSYSDACSQFGEETVLEKFEAWAPDNMWIKERRHTNGLRQFYDSLPAMIEADTAILAEDDQKKQTEETAKDQEKQLIDQIQNAAAVRNEQIRRDREFEDAQAKEFAKSLLESHG